MKRLSLQKKWSYEDYGLFIFEVCRRSERDRKSMSGFYTYVGEILLPDAARSITLCHDPVQRQSIDPWLRWLNSLLLELGFIVEMPTPMHCDNQAAIFIANNPTFHKRTKHIEIDYHYVQDMVMK